jgi:selenocysteine-specific elongation factor
MEQEQAQAGAQRSFVIGTAGHVDHGKSTLVKALTGIDPDRLAEEKARELTIDLGFAWLDLPDGRRVSIVDVPGHERFIKNMLAGVGGIDAALLVIDADEGPMPQTVEHLAILDLLQVKAGVVALTKIDLVDPEWQELVTEEVRELITGTVLDGAAIVPVSGVTGEGLPALLDHLQHLLDASPERHAHAGPRLPVDRVFTVSGFGTVVTGTLLDGHLTVGQELRLLPSGKATRARGLQVHGAKVERAAPGSRVAVNLAAIATDEVKRGDVLAAPGQLAASYRFDARLKLLADAPVVLEQNSEVDVFVGAAETPAKLTLLDRDQLEPGDEAWVQVRLRDPVAVLQGDRFIIRRPSPSITIGGGEIIDPAPLRHKRFRDEVIAGLETLAVGSPEEIVLQFLQDHPHEIRTLRERPPAGLTQARAAEAVKTLLASGAVRLLRGQSEGEPKPGDFVVATATWEQIAARLERVLAAFHEAQPLRRGIPREELKSRAGLSGPARLFDLVLATAEADGRLVNEGETVRLAEFRIVLDAARRDLADRFLAALDAQPASPPAPGDFGIDADTLGALIDLGDVVKVTDGVVYARRAFAAIERDVLALIDRDGSLTLSQFRDHFGTSRKYAQATLEYLDQQRVTRRVGDERVRYSGSGSGNSKARATTDVDS